MTHPPYLRDKAIRLRVERKMTLDEIAERLALGKTTIWYWIRDLPIPRSHFSAPGDRPHLAAARRKGNAAMQQKHRIVREAAYVSGWNEFALLDAEPGFRDFVCMYIGEGYKRNRNRVGICNSDPRIIRLGDHWIRRFAANKVDYSFQHHADQDPEYLVQFWSTFLGADPSAFRFQRKSNSGQLEGRNWRSKWGVLSVGTNDTQFRARLQGWIDRVQDGWIDSIYGA